MGFGAVHVHVCFALCITHATPKGSREADQPRAIHDDGLKEKQMWGSEETPKTLHIYLPKQLAFEVLSIRKLEITRYVKFSFCKFHSLLIHKHNKTGRHLGVCLWLHNIKGTFLFSMNFVKKHEFLQKFVLYLSNTSYSLLCVILFQNCFNFFDWRFQIGYDNV
jgi:hypothetical protein